MQLYIGNRHILTVADYGLSLFCFNLCRLNNGKMSFWVDGCNWDIQHVSHKLDTSMTIRIGGWEVKATRLIPWVNLYKLRYVTCLQVFDPTPIEDYDF